MVVYFSKIKKKADASYEEYYHVFVLLAVGIKNYQKF